MITLSPQAAMNAQQCEYSHEWQAPGQNDNVFILAVKPSAAFCGSSPCRHFLHHPPMPRTVTKKISPLQASITLHDVAKAAGVSLVTASRALKKPELVSPATIEKVERAVHKTGYIPNLLAGGLKSNKSLTVAALVPYIAVPQFLPTLQALTETLDEAGYQLILGQTGYNRARETALLNTMITRRVDGIVFAGLLSPDAPLAQFARLNIPVVETWDLTARPLDMLVGFSHAQVGASVGGFFLKRGWRKIGIATADDERAMQRCQGVLSVMGGNVPVAKVKAPSTLQSGRMALAELLKRQPKLQAVYCSSDGMAHGLMIEARERGLNVPQDLAVCGFGDADFAAHLAPALTTVRVDGAEIGRQAARMVLARCRGETVAERVVDVGFRIIERASTGKA
jgi:LacI family transcriptional regulator, gluconate utilization system Gnt-I transcriptional repressor